MRILQNNAHLLIDLSNFVARAIAVAQQNYLALTLHMLLKLRRQYQYHQLVFAVEGSGTIRRQRLLTCYKDGRIPSPEFNDARRTAIQMLRLIKCRFIMAPDGEADDAIACFCDRNSDDEVIIVSNDRDLWQLINTNVKVLSTVKRSTFEVDKFACQRLLGVLPHEIPLMKAMLGDTSDNIPRAVERVHKTKILRLVHAANGDLDKVPSVASLDFLTEKDRERVTASLAVVKQHLDVTRAWNNLDLKQRHHEGDYNALQLFLSEHAVALEKAEMDELKSITGKSK
jgi:5'-3' exonuclease